MKTVSASALKAVVALIVMLVLQTAGVKAWKVDAHVWIAAEVLKDAIDGSITVQVGSNKVRIRLPERYAAALRAHPRLYLLGSLGPDAFPDVLGGQLVIHPSFPGGWGTSEWLRRLMDTPNMSSEEVAFTLGYLSHAAADTFAHTFVNQYAGDLFQAFKHSTAAQRHIFIEGLVSNYLPPISVPQLGAPRDAAALLRGRREKIRFPERLMRDRIFLSGEAADQFGRGGATHLSLAYGLHRDLGNLIEKGGPLDQLQIKVKDFIAEMYLGVPIDDRIVKRLQELENELTDKLNKAVGEELKPILDDLNDKLTKIEGLPDKFAEESMKAAVDLLAELGRLQQEIDDWRNEFVKAEREIQRLIASNLDKVAHDVCDSWVSRFLGGAICASMKTVHYATKAMNDATHQLHQAESSVRRLTNDIASRRERLKRAISSGMAVLRQRHEFNRLARSAVIAAATDRPFGDGLRHHFQRWHESVPIALVEFSRAHAATIVNSVDPEVVKSRHPDRIKLMEPLQNWVICYGPVFLSVPAYLGDSVCAGIDGIGTLKDKINDFEQKLGKVVPPLGKAMALKTEILTELEKLKKKVLDVAMLEGLKAFDSITDARTAGFYEALATEITPDKVNEAMKDEGGQRLPIIPDAAQRVIQELRLNASGHIDPAGFPAIYDSIVLAKLALLDAAGLQQLARSVGINESSVYADGLYGDKSPYAQNILFGFLRSIDGNHQWQELAPPHPRTSAAGYDVGDFEKRARDPENHGYGYRDRNCVRTLGMRLWVDPRARELIFKKMFRGQITRGIDEPESLGAGFASALPKDYPKLYNQADGWWIDAIEIRPEGAGVTIGLAGRGPANVRADLLIPGQDRRTIAGDADGMFHESVFVPAHLLPTRIELIETNVRNALRFAFDVGCDGRPIQAGMSVDATVVVERGDNLWRIAQRITGDGRRYPELAEANKAIVANPRIILPGQVLRSPWGMPYSLSLR